MVEVYTSLNTGSHHNEREPEIHHEMGHEYVYKHSSHNHVRPIFYGPGSEPLFENFLRKHTFRYTFLFQVEAQGDGKILAAVEEIRPINPEHGRSIADAETDTNHGNNKTQGGNRNQLTFPMVLPQYITDEEYTHTKEKNLSKFIHPHRQTPERTFDPVIDVGTVFTVGENANDYKVRERVHEPAESLPLKLVHVITAFVAIDEADAVALTDIMLEYPHQMDIDNHTGGFLERERQGEKGKRKPGQIVGVKPEGLATFGSRVYTHVGSNRMGIGKEMLPHGSENDQERTDRYRSGHSDGWLGMTPAEYPVVNTEK